MKTRIIKTEFWEDMAGKDVPKDARLLFVYLITNPRINMCGIFELSDKYILLETGLTPKELEKAKGYLQEIKKILFIKGWVKITNAEKHNNYKGSPKNEVAYERELALIPSHIKEDFNSSIDSSITTTIDTNHKSEIIDQKPEIKKDEDEKEKIYASLSYLKELPLDEVTDLYKKYEASERQIRMKAIELANYCDGHGKKYKNYRAMLMNALMKDFGMRKPVYNPPTPEPEVPMSPERKAAAAKTLAELRAKFHGKHTL
ncbi:MAG TPA: hypothetical protein VE090_02560 [Methylomirabilota bacterium]|nr:hypothetical protein [Methylomirabilota bacterium]